MNNADRTADVALVAAWLDLWNGDYEVASRIISADSRVHAAMFDGGDGSAVGGIDGMVSMVSQIRSLFRTLTFRIDVGPIIDPSLIAVRWVASGEYGGSFPGARATPGTEVTFHGTDVLRTEGGVIQEYWLNADTLSLVTQLKVEAS